MHFCRLGQVLIQVRYLLLGTLYSGAVLSYGAIAVNYFHDSCVREQFDVCRKRFCSCWTQDWM